MMTKFAKFVLPSIFVLAGLFYLIGTLISGGGVGGVVAGAIVGLIGVALFFIMPIVTRR